MNSFWCGRVARTAVVISVALLVTAPGPASSASRPSLAVSVWAARPGEPVGLTGSVPDGPRPVELQRKVGRAWIDVADGMADGKGGFAFSTTMRRTTTHYRVVAPAVRQGGRARPRATTPARSIAALSAGQHRGGIELVPGTLADDGGYLDSAALSDDGRIVIYVWSSPETRPHGQRWVDSLWRYDTATGERTRIETGKGTVFTTAISGDGRYVAYSDLASIYVYDSDTGATELASVPPEPGRRQVYAIDPDLSADGRYVVFSAAFGERLESAGETLVDVYRRDRRTGQTVLISHTASGALPDGFSDGAQVSDDGQVVAYRSYATDLVRGDTNATGDAFVADLTAGTTRRVSVATDGSQAHPDAYGVALSADGSTVSFQASGPGLAPGVGRGDEQVYRHDLGSGLTEVVSLTPDGRPGNSYARFPQLSADGRYVVFTACASDLLPDDDRALFDVYLRDTELGATSRVSKNLSGRTGNDSSGPYAISADARTVLFSSEATNLLDTAVRPGGLYLWRSAD